MHWRESLEVVALVFQILGFLAIPIAAWSILRGRKEAKASRDLQISLNLISEFRIRWERDWRGTLASITAAEKVDEMFNQNQNELLNMLNWVDWVGTLISTQALSNADIIFGSIRPQCAQIINSGKDIVESGVAKEGSAYWKGLFVVGHAIEIEWTQKYFESSHKSPG